MERSVLAFDNWKTSQEKFDYFILGVIGALCAYLSQNIELAPLGYNSSTMELLALMTIFLSGIAGFLRLEEAIELHALNHHQLHLNEKKGQLVSKFSGGPMLNSETGEVLSPHQVAIEVGAIDHVMPEIKGKIQKYTSRSSIYYKLRNIFLLIGFLMIVGAKVWAAYEAA